MPVSGEWRVAGGECARCSVGATQVSMVFDSVDSVSVLRRGFLTSTSVGGEFARCSVGSTQDFYSDSAVLKKGFQP